MPAPAWKAGSQQGGIAAKPDCWAACLGDGTGRVQPAEVRHGSAPTAFDVPATLPKEIKEEKYVRVGATELQPKALSREMRTTTSIEVLSEQLLSLEQMLGRRLDSFEELLEQALRPKAEPSGETRSDLAGPLRSTAPPSLPAPGEGAAAEHHGADDMAMQAQVSAPSTAFGRPSGVPTRASRSSGLAGQMPHSGLRAGEAEEKALRLGRGLSDGSRPTQRHSSASSASCRPSIDSAGCATSIVTLSPDREPDSSLGMDGWTEMWPLWRATPVGHTISRLRVGVFIRLQEIHDLWRLQTFGLANCHSEGIGGTNIFTQPRGCVLHPTSSVFLGWLVLSPVLLLYDIVVIPMFSFPVPDLAIFTVMAWVIAIYWSVDLIRSFFTGYELSSGDGVEMRPRVVAMAYLRTWFILDFPTVIVDWLLIMLGAGSMFNKFWRAGRAVRAWRVLRAVRLVRVFKAAKNMWNVLDSVKSFYTVVLLRGSGICVCLLFVCHYMACGWQALGEQDHFLGGATPEITWVTEYGKEDAGFWEAYATATHYALAQGGFAPIDVFPANPLERVFAVGCGFYWLIVMSVVICLATTWASQLRESTSEQNTQQLQLRKFLEEHGCSRALTYKILRCFRWNFRTYMRRVREEDIEFLKDIPGDVQIRLHSEMYLLTLSRHIFFQALSSFSSTILKILCHLALSEMHCVAGDAVFMEGCRAEFIYHCNAGDSDYYCVVKNMERTRLSKGFWACEPAMWLKWTLRGRLVAATSCDMMAVNVEKMLAVVEDQDRGNRNLEDIRQFAADVVTHFLEVAPDMDIWPDVEEVFNPGRWAAGQ